MRNASKPARNSRSILTTSSRASRTICTELESYVAISAKPQPREATPSWTLAHRPKTLLSEHRIVPNKPWPNMTKQPETSSRPISDTELVDALDAAGYPLEIEVFKKLKDAELSPVLGMRVKVRDDGGSGGFTTSEIDLLAQKHIHMKPSALVHGVTVRQRSMIDVKKVHAPRAFAGICGVDRDPPEKRSLRCRVGGAPAWDLFSRRKGDDTAWVGPDGFATCLDPMNQGAWCVQWAVVDRRKNKRNSKEWPAVATHEEGFHDAFMTLDRASLEANRSWTEFLANQEEENHYPEINIALNMTTIVLDTPCLYALDPLSRKLTPTQWLTIERYTEHRGAVRRSITDVICLKSLQLWIDAMKETSVRIERWLEENADGLKRYAEASRS